MNMSGNHSESDLFDSTNEHFMIHLMEQTGKIVYKVLPFLGLCGLLTNVIMFVKLYRIRKANPALTPALTLQYLCISDNVCLLFLSMYSLSRVSQLHKSEILPDWSKEIYCRFVMYFIHTAAAFSVWCFPVLSGFRYLAVFNPFFLRAHPQLNRPSLILLVICVTWAVLELWLPSSVTYMPEIGDCANTLSILSEGALTTMATVDIMIAFFIPALACLVIDLAVRTNQRKQKRLAQQEHQDKLKSIKHSEKLLSEAERDTNGDIVHETSIVLIDKNDVPKTTVSKPVEQYDRTASKLVRFKKVTRLLNRYIMLTWLDLALTLPLITTRTMAIFELSHYVLVLDWPLLTASYKLFTVFAYVLYYAQFSINWLYFWLVWPLVLSDHETVPNTHNNAK